MAVPGGSTSSTSTRRGPACNTSAPRWPRSCGWRAMRPCRWRRAEASAATRRPRRCSRAAWRGSCWARPRWRTPAWRGGGRAAGPGGGRGGRGDRGARRWPGRVAVGLDYRVGTDGVAEAQAQGWLAKSGWAVTELLDLWANEPIGAVVATAVARDGMLEGPDLEGMAALLARSGLPFVASGGVGSTADLQRLAGLEANGRRLSGAIVGKALVERRFSVEEGLAAGAA